MKCFIGLLLSLSSIAVHAITYEVIGPCSEKPLYAGTFNIADLKKDNVGKVSLAIFNSRKIPHSGTEAGFTSILGTPTGIDSIETLSDTKMRAHGWCYAVNNIGPDVAPSDYFFATDDDKLVWFYGHSTYDNGQWVDYCVPTYTVKPLQFCNK